MRSARLASSCRSTTRSSSTCPREPAQRRVGVREQAPLVATIPQVVQAAVRDRAIEVRKLRAACPGAAAGPGTTPARRPSPRRGLAACVQPFSTARDRSGGRAPSRWRGPFTGRWRASRRTARLRPRTAWRRRRPRTSARRSATARRPPTRTARRVSHQAPGGRSSRGSGAPVHPSTVAQLEARQHRVAVALLSDGQRDGVVPGRRAHQERQRLPLRARNPLAGFAAAVGRESPAPDRPTRRDRCRR